MAAMDRIQASVIKNVTDMVNHAANIVADDIYAYNRGFYEGYQWVACLDAGTCPACAAVDNKVFKNLPVRQEKAYDRDGNCVPPDEVLEDSVPERPLHPNCRCIAVPILKGDTEGAAAMPNYEQWLEKQPKGDHSWTF